jgi:adenylate cyclase class IV
MRTASSSFAFVELEVVLRDGESPESGEDEAKALMEALEIAPAALISGAYIDLVDRPVVSG